MGLNEECNHVPYVLGRLFAVYEAAQEAANPSINATIRDKYFAAAMATPGKIFPVLNDLFQKHLRKLSVAQKIFYDKQVSELLGKMDTEYPMHFSLPEQGSFNLGYYHQKQKRFEKKENK